VQHGKSQRAEVFRGLFDKGYVRIVRYKNLAVTALAMSTLITNDTNYSNFTNFHKKCSGLFVPFVEFVIKTDEAMTNIRVMAE